ncbi:anibiotic ABC transporter efflux pump [Cellulomonas flavigena DSM 20109]|uniref:Anibiotic ABC transporter efflux pump n=1 Tax=Cellulomonas flavigena (strain ATCC 482 / DSM 20109 / BCRC 11376 / JCM 18109 / NBRC 3775 / NCIMB 8073 / NRS 134) TaxID=446466 RepID=D5UDG6_CELFN|nr:antibiotic ABC transporter [Cellulomonas flavigena]ADG76422.1 anibiotic ABC transporter efflux pump [Cellulomonas flavigena DSM 20109]
MTTTRRRREATPDAAASAATTVTGTLRLLRFGLRRDRVRLPVWALSVGGLIAYFGAAIPAVYPDAAAMQTRAAIMKDPSGAFMTGPGYGLDDYTFGVMIANEMLGMIAVAVALMSLFLVVRHTRAEEETGRADLLRAGVVGRDAPLAAALLLLVVANLAVAGVLLAALLANGLAAADSAAIAAGAATVGLVFGALAAVTAQLSAHARTASGMAGGILGLAYVLRGVGDAAQPGGSTLSWLSPIGWAQQTRAFVDLRWWPLLLGLGTAVLLVGGALLLVGRRDVGAGLVPARGGRADARRALLSPAGLAWRTERSGIAWWAVGLFVFAVLTGSMAQGIVDSFASQPQLAEVFGGAALDDVLSSTLSAFLAFFAMAVAVYAVVSVNRLNREEDDGRAGVVLATAVSRPAWLGGTLLVTAVGSTLLLLVCGFGLGAGVASSVGGGGHVGAFTAAALVYLPVVLGFQAVAALAHGARAGTWWVWLLLVTSILVGLYGPLFNLPDAVLDAAPFALVPHAPYEAVTVLPLALLTLTAGALTATAAVALRRRDMTA